MLKNCRMIPHRDTYQGSAPLESVGPTDMGWNGQLRLATPAAATASNLLIIPKHGLTAPYAIESQYMPRLCLKSQETEMWPRNSLGSVQSPAIYGKEFCDGKAL